MKDVIDISCQAILTIATVILAWKTWQLVIEQIAIRKASVQPYITVYLETAETNPTWKFLIVQNIGQGVAKDLKFEIKKDLTGYGSQVKSISSIGLFKHGMTFFPPNYSKKFFLFDSTGKELAERLFNDEIIFNVSYNNIFDNNKKEEFIIKLAEHRGASQLNHSDKYIGRIAESLIEIKNILTAKSK